MSTLESRLSVIRDLLVASKAELQPDGRWFAPDRSSFVGLRADGVVPPWRFIAWFDGSCLGTILTIVKPSGGGGIEVSKFEVDGSKNLREIGAVLS